MRPPLCFVKEDFINRDLLCDGSNVNKATSVLAFGEDYGTVNEGVESVVLTHAYVETGVVNRATLTLQDVTGLGKLAAKNLNTQTFAF